jgi:hypothetical protein
MRTTEAILAEIHEHKTCSKQQLYRYFAAFNITPVGVRQRPRLYPDDAAQRILKQLGLVTDAGCGAPGCPNAAPVKLVTTKELRSIRDRSKAARRAA